MRVPDRERNPVLKTTVLRRCLILLLRPKCPAIMLKSTGNTLETKGNPSLSRGRKVPWLQGRSEEPVKAGAGVRGVEFKVEGGAEAQGLQCQPGQSPALRAGHLSVGTVRFSSRWMWTCGLTYEEREKMCEKREKPSQADAVPFISIMRSTRPGLLTQLAVARARMGARSPPWQSSLPCNMQTAWTIRRRRQESQVFQMGKWNAFVKRVESYECWW